MAVPQATTCNDKLAGDSTAIAFRVDPLTINSNTVAVRDELSQYFDTMPADQSFPQLIGLLQTTINTDEQLAELAAEAWDYIISKQLWKVGYDSLEAFRADLGFEHTLESLIERHEQTKSRKQIETRGIMKNWNCPPEKALPVDIMPPWMSDDFLRNLRRLSKKCPLDAAIPLLNAAICVRIERPKTSKEPYLL